MNNMALDRITVASVQFDPQFMDASQNLDKIEALSRRAKEVHEADLIVFPEGAVTGYCFKSREEAASVAISQEGPECARLKALAAALNASLVVGTVEEKAGEIYNSVWFIEPDGGVFTYHKSHLPYLGVDRFVKEGDCAGGVFDTRFGKIGLIVCYELRFPESARVAALGGARLILQPTNLPEGGESHPDFLTRARACENRVHFVSCNRIGTERGFTFIGRSQIVDFGGTVLAECPRGEEGIIAATLDLTPCEDKDIIGTPGERELYLFRHRRWDLYGPLAQRPDEKGFL